MSLNLYTYCHNEPIMYTDPSGHSRVYDEYYNSSAPIKTGNNNVTNTSNTANKSSSTPKATPKPTAAPKATPKPTPKPTVTPKKSTKDVDSTGSIDKTGNTKNGISDNSVKEETDTDPTITMPSEDTIEITVPSSISPQTAFIIGFDDCTGGFVIGGWNMINGLMGKQEITQYVIDYNKEYTYGFKDSYERGQAAGGLSILTSYVAALFSGGTNSVTKGASKSIELKGTYGPEYTNKLQSTYNQFANEGVDITEHGLNRVLGRSSRGVTVENTIDVYNNGKLYYDPQYNTNIKFKDGIAVSYDIKSGQIVNVQTQNNPTSRWIAK